MSTSRHNGDAHADARHTDRAVVALTRIMNTSAVLGVLSLITAVLVIVYQFLNLAVFNTLSNTSSPPDAAPPAHIVIARINSLVYIAKEAIIVWFLWIHVTRSYELAASDSRNGVSDVGSNKNKLPRTPGAADVPPDSARLSARVGTTQSQFPRPASSLVALTPAPSVAAASSAA